MTAGNITCFLQREKRAFSGSHKENECLSDDVRRQTHNMISTYYTCRVVGVARVNA